jgi:molecular chaperone GrpE
MIPEDGDEQGQKLVDEVEGASAPEGDQVEAGDDGAIPEEVVSPDAASQAQIDALGAELEDTKGRLLRVAADFENFRRRAKREAEDSRVRGREEVLKELLGVFDNLERATEAAGEHVAGPAAIAILEGVTLVQKQFSDGMAKFGMKQFSALNKPFDPNFHEAMQQTESNAHEPGYVVLEYQKGYMLGERLLRPSMVVVSSPSSKIAAPAEPEGVAEEEAEATIQVSMSDLPLPGARKEEGSAE